MEHYESPDRILTISTAHLTSEEYRELEALPTTARYEYGLVWDRYVDGETSFGYRFNFDNVDGARFIRFDRDGDMYPSLVSYMEEHV